MATTSQQQLEILTGKILSRAQARGGFSTSLLYEPDDRMEAAHGRLLFVIDISSPSPLSADIAYNLIDIIKEEFYSDLELPASEGFENALKAANEELAAIAKQGEKDWIGKFNAIIAAIHGKNLYIVQRGTAEIHLLRGANMLNLSKGIYTPGESYKPEETMVNLIEGQVQVGDKLIASTSELFYYISIEKLKRIIESSSPAQAAKRLADQLGSENEINRTSVLISEFTLPELMGEESDHKNSENWVGAKEEPRRMVAAVTPPAETIDKEKSIEDITHAYRANDFAPKSEHPTIEDDVIVEEASAATGLSAMMPKWSGAKFDEFKNNLHLDQYASKLKMDSPAWQNAMATAWRIVRGVGRLVGSIFQSGYAYAVTLIKAIKRRRDGNRILIAMVVGLAALIVISSVGISRGYAQHVNLNKATAALASAKQKRDAAQAAMIYENGAQARDLLAEAYALAETATANKKTHDEASKLAGDLLTQLDTASSTKRFKNVQALADFSGLNSQLGGTSTAPKSVSLNNMTPYAGNLYAVDSANNKIYKFNTLTGAYAIANSLDSTDSKLKLITSGTADKSLLLYATPGSVYNFDTDKNTLSGSALDSGNWATADKMVAYTNKIYMMDQAANQIRKYQVMPAGYTSVAPYFESQDGINIKGALDFAIDGNVWVLMPGNIVQKFQNGAAATFTLQQAPDPYAKLGNITAMYTDSNSQLYLLDSANNRVIEYNKDGNFLGQWMWDDTIKNPTALSVDEAGGFIYVTAGTSVFRLPIK